MVDGMYPDLRTFLGVLEEAGELVRVREDVSPVLEISAIADQISKTRAPVGPSASARRTDPQHWDRGGPAILFERVTGSDIPVLINAYGSYRRMEMALGCDEHGHTPGGFEAIGARIGALLKPEPPRSWREALGLARRMAPLARIGPKRLRGKGACQERVVRAEAIDLTKLPLLRCWPGDGDFGSMGYPEDVNSGVEGLGHPEIDDERWEALYRGRYITFAGVHTIHARDAGESKPASHNIGMYRVQLMGRDRLAMHWHMHHDGAAHWRSWKELGKPMPVAVVLGGPSVLPYAATAPLPPGMGELLLAGFLNRRGIRLCRGESVPLWVPADAEIVIEGFVRPDAGGVGFDPRTDELGPGAVFEGPFGDHTGFYSLPDRYPILEVSAVTMRERPVFPATVVGPPPQEDYFLGKATERVFFPMLKTLIHDVEDYDLPMFGAFHNCAFLQIRKAYPLQARRVMHAVWGAGQMAWTKTVFVVGDDVDVHDWRAVVRAAAEMCDPTCDVERVSGPLDILDHAAVQLGAGGKMGFDCTHTIEGERLTATGQRIQNRPFAGHAEIVTQVVGVDGVLGASMPEALGGWLFVSTNQRGRDEIEALAGRVIEAAGGAGYEPPAFVVILGEDVDVSDDSSAMFHWVANADMLRDAEVVGRTMWFDSTPKSPDGYPEIPARRWPAFLEMDEAVRERVSGIVAGLQPPSAG